MPDHFRKLGTCYVNYKAKKTKTKKKTTTTEHDREQEDPCANKKHFW